MLRNFEVVVFTTRHEQLNSCVEGRGQLLSLILAVRDLLKVSIEELVEIRSRHAELMQTHNQSKNLCLLPNNITHVPDLERWVHAVYLSGGVAPVAVRSIIDYLLKQVNWKSSPA